jgi:hypothetical protein
LKIFSQRRASFFACAGPCQPSGTREIVSSDSASANAAGASPPAQRVLYAANSVADFPADLVGLSFAFELLVAGRLADDLLDLTLDLLSRTLDAILVHCMSPIDVTGER